MSRRPSKANLLRISEIAQKAGVLSSTIRYYTDMGLISIASETKGGHRLYEEASTINAIKKIQFLNKQGFTIEQIKNEMSSGEVRKKILIIDDEPEVGNFITEIVQNSFPEVEVRMVYDGFAAGRVLGEFLPDLIFLDLMLPGVDGFVVCRQIRSTDFLSGVKIIAVTGYDSPENREKIKACGADDYLPKPMDLKVIREKIAVHLKISPSMKA
ncbi:MAG: response regulator [Endomicrobiales bacterium]|nr:response regulator [Endomicrobiales bacterium]